MSAIMGERITLTQDAGADITLFVEGDEFYSIHETLDGYTVQYNMDVGQFCYAVMMGDELIASEFPASQPPPEGMRRHLREPLATRGKKFEQRFAEMQPRERAASRTDTILTIGPNNGLLPGRRHHENRVRGLTILVEFDDVSTTISRQQVDEMLNAEDYNANGNACSVREYFRAISSGRLDYSNTVVGPFKLSKKRRDYHQTLLVEEALDLAIADGVDLADFDSRGEGIVDALNIMYAGPSLFVSGTSRLWPHNSVVSLPRGGVRTHFYQLVGLGRNADDLAIGTFCHENGHLLCRFPDMYDYGNAAREGDAVKSAGIGTYCLMGSGNQLNFGRTPSPVCAYLRDLAGWCSNEISLNAPGDYEAAQGDYNTVVKYRLADRPNEYFIIENRFARGLDEHLPSSGLAIYHCDILGSNEFQQGTEAKHYQCALIQADGNLDLEGNHNQGDSGDLYGARQGIALSHATSPAARRWDGSDSGLVVSRIGAPSQAIRFATGEIEESDLVSGQCKFATAEESYSGTGVMDLSGNGVARTIRLDVEFDEPPSESLEMELVAPSGKWVSLKPLARGAHVTLRSEMNSEIAPLVGQPIGGKWQLRLAELSDWSPIPTARWSLDVATGCRQSDGRAPVGVRNAPMQRSKKLQEV